MIAISCPKLILIPFRLKLNSLKNKYYEEKKNAEIISPKTEDYSKKPLKNWKRCIDDYPKEYFNPQKKALDGNIISFSIYPYLKAKSEALHVQLSDAQNKTQLTKKQIKRIAKIPLQIVNPGLS